MKRVVLAAILLGACGGAVVTPSPSPTPTASATATASPRPTASAAATPITSAKGGITVNVPLSNARVTSPVTISGEASVFEAALQWQIVDAGGSIIAQGIATASAGAPSRGTFSFTATFPPPAADTTAGIVVFDRSPKDGTIDEQVRVPVVLGK